MKYMGSKARIAKQIAPIINHAIQQHGINWYIEPFVGGANMMQHIQCPTKSGADINIYLIRFLQEIQAGWNPLETVEMSKELYQKIRDNPGGYPPHIVALAGFCASYNAKWFGGYAGTVKTKINTYRNYYDEAVRNVLKQADKIKDVDFLMADYRFFSGVKGACVYCDPPYKGVTGYHGEFDHSQYWDWVREMSRNNLVFCSEYEAPPDFECVWSAEITTTMDKSSRKKAQEKLFIHRQLLGGLKNGIRCST